MRLEDLDWKQVPEHVSVITYKDGYLNFAVNLRDQEAGSRWIVEGDECDLYGDVIDQNQGWGHDWKLLERPSTEQSPTQDNTSSAVVDWLDKLVYVLARDYTVNEIYRASDTDMEIFSDCGNITGNQNVAEFINNRYSQLTERANKAKREELLADIVKAKEVYEKLVGALAELEGK